MIKRLILGLLCLSLAGPALAQFGGGSPPGGGGGGAGNTVTLTADTNIAAGTAVAVNASGHAVQGWGPAPNVAGTAQLTFAGAVAPWTAVATISLSPSLAVIFQANQVTQSAMPVSVSGGVVTAGTENTATPSAHVNMPEVSGGGTNSGAVTATAVDATHFIVLYNDIGGTGNASVAVGSVSGGVISYGTGVQLDTHQEQGYANIAMLDATHFVVVWSGSDDGFYNIVGSISGTTVTIGTKVEIVAGGEVNGLAVLSSSLYAVAYLDDSAGNHLKTYAASVSGTTLTPGSLVTLTGMPTNPYCARVSATSYVISSADVSSLQAVGVTVSGTTVTPGTILIVAAHGSFSLAPSNAAFPAAQQWLESFGSNVLIQGGAFWAPQIGTLSGNTLSLSTPVGIGPGDLVGVGNLDVLTGGGVIPPGNLPVHPFGTFAVLSSSQAIVIDSNFTIYQEDAAGALSQPIKHQFLNGYWLTTMDSTHALATLTDVGGHIFARSVTAEPTAPSGPMGFAAASITSGLSGEITLSGAISGFSGLTPGARYYVDGDGTLTTANTGWFAGTALTSSSLMSPGISQVQ